jgi:hypothetical protein
MATPTRKPQQLINPSIGYTTVGGSLNGPADSPVERQENLNDILAEIDAALSQVQADAYNVASLVGNYPNSAVPCEQSKPPATVIEFARNLRARVFSVQGDLGLALTSLGPIGHLRTE